MKKALLSLSLAVLLIAAFALPAFAATYTYHEDWGGGRLTIVTDLKEAGVAFSIKDIKINGASVAFDASELIWENGELNFVNGWADGANGWPAIRDGLGVVGSFDSLSVTLTIGTDEGTGFTAFIAGTLNSDWIEGTDQAVKFDAGNEFTVTIGTVAGGGGGGGSAGGGDKENAAGGGDATMITLALLALGLGGLGAFVLRRKIAA
jgi:hypothetical protein